MQEMTIKQANQVSQLGDVVSIKQVSKVKADVC